jgi:hypothetical protein
MREEIHRAVKGLGLSQMKDRNEVYWSKEALVIQR